MADDPKGPPGSTGEEPSSEQAHGPASYDPSGTSVQGRYDEPYAYNPEVVTEKAVTVAPVVKTLQGPVKPPPPPPPPDDPADAEEDGMLRMSFLDHLDELRRRIIFILYGLGVAFISCVYFSDKLWLIASEPATSALRNLGVNPPKLAALTPMESFSTIWVKLPLLTSLFVVSPWVLYQVWAFISPGLYKKERRWAAPFVIVSAGLFISGGMFAYFVAFRYGIEFLLGIGRDINVTPVISISEYFDLFVNVTLGIGLVFELPMIIFFLTLLRLASPKFLLEHSRYAILAIVILAAIITPTPDIFNLMLFAVPMCLLFFIGVFASYVLVLRREKLPFPWKAFALTMLVIVALAVGCVVVAIRYYHYHLLTYWPFISR